VECTTVQTVLTAAAALRKYSAARYKARRPRSCSALGYGTSADAQTINYILLWVKASVELERMSVGIA
jgi:hypothetical protein